eukprot:gene15077-17849_t
MGNLCGKTNNEHAVPAKHRTTAPPAQAAPKSNPGKQPAPRDNGASASSPNTAAAAAPKTPATTTTTPAKSHDQVVADNEEVSQKINAVYKKSQAEVDAIATKRSQLFDQAEKEYNSGNKDRARELREQAKEQTSAMEAAQKKATRTIFNYTNEKLDKFTIDLHGLKAKDAIEMLDERLGELKGQTGKQFTIITGAGNHSDDSGPKIKPLVHQTLKDRSIKYSEVNNGSIQITFLDSDDEFYTCDTTAAATAKKNAASKKAERKKQKKKERDALVKQLAEDQQMEVDALQAIFQDDFALLPTPSFSNETFLFTITIRPMSLSDHDCFVIITLTIGLVTMYPTTPPNISIAVNKGLPNKNVPELEDLLEQEAKSKIGNQMVFDICGVAREYLTAHNQKPSAKSVHDQMVEQQKELERLKKIFSEYFAKPVGELPSGLRPKQSSGFVGRVWSAAAPAKESLSPVHLDVPIMPAHHHNPNVQTSRYRGDFEEIQLLGRGGFGQVVKVRNRLDGRFYAIKKIKLDSDQTLNKRILREVITLSRLHHQHVVRYYQAWIEGAEGLDTTPTLEKDPNHMADGDELSDSEESDETNSSEQDQSFSDDIHFPKQSIEFDLTDDSYSFLHSDSGFLFEVFDLNNKGSTAASRSNNTRSRGGSRSATTPPRPRRKEKASAYLYIQMEYCQKILRNLTEAGISSEDDDIWKLFRQIVEGMAYVHSQGIIHRDLKPSNIFFDSCGDIKIGDFGLATGLATPATDAAAPPSNMAWTGTDSADTSELSLDGVEQHTARVGTLFYTSPEQESGDLEDTRYDDKVDMYSLGIVFFEMWYVFSTGHERVAVLKDLRERGIFPPNFERNHPRQVRVISWLTQRDPSRRPTAQELLQSELMPPKMEDEYMKNAIRVITNPTTQFYPAMLTSLFSPVHQHLHEHIYHQHATSVRPGPSAGASLYNLDEISVHEAVNDSITSVFKKHNANVLTTPLMGVVRNWDVDEESATKPPIAVTAGPHAMQPSPKKERASSKSIVMDDSGQLFEMRYDLRETFADYLARQLSGSHPRAHSTRAGDHMDDYDDEDDQLLKSRGLDNVEDLLHMFEATPLKRYEIGSVYRKPHLVGRAPKELSQCCFDIVGSASLFADAEVVKVACEVFDSLPSVSRTHTIRMNHAVIINHMWRVVGITEAKQREEIGMVLAQLLRQPWTVVKKALLERLSLPPKTVERLANWVLVKGPIPDVIKKLESSTTGGGLLTASQSASVRLSASFGDVLDDIRTLYSYLEKLGVANKVTFDLGHVYCEDFYSGVMFQVVVREETSGRQECIAVGGRYDAAVSKLIPLHNVALRKSDEHPSAPVVGLSFALDKIYQKEKDHEQLQKLLVSPQSFQAHSTTASHHHAHKFSTPDIFICSLGTNLFNERISIVSDLWNAGFKVDTVYKENPSAEEQAELSQRSGALFVVTVKEKGGKKIIKILQKRKKEEDISREDLVKFFILSNLSRSKTTTSSTSQSSALKQ